MPHRSMSKPATKIEKAIWKSEAILGSPMTFSIAPKRNALHAYYRALDHIEKKMGLTVNTQSELDERIQMIRSHREVAISVLAGLYSIYSPEKVNEIARQFNLLCIEARLQEIMLTGWFKGWAFMNRLEEFRIELSENSSPYAVTNLAAVNEDIARIQKVLDSIRVVTKDKYQALAKYLVEALDQPTVDSDDYYDRVFMCLTLTEKDFTSTIHHNWGVQFDDLRLGTL